ncbi:MAG TPA: 50S ribosomal protein L17 [Candidatus Paceibacterota bacterium]|nr:50S ribosomal protein L17 [Candidatus Paceibacterota bacterium]
MRHGKKTRKFKRDRDQRKALLKALSVALITREKITTTEAKAKELRPHIEKIVTAAKTDSVASRRLLAAKIGNGSALTKVFKDVAPKFKDVQGGYTRIIKLPKRMKDAAKMAFIEFVK